MGPPAREARRARRDRGRRDPRWPRRIWKRKRNRAAIAVVRTVLRIGFHVASRLPLRHYSLACAPRQSAKRDISSQICRFDIRRELDCDGKKEAKTKAHLGDRRRCSILHFRACTASSLCTSCAVSAAPPTPLDMVQSQISTRIQRLESSSGASSSALPARRAAHQARGSPLRHAKRVARDIAELESAVRIDERKSGARQRTRSSLSGIKAGRNCSSCSDFRR